MESFLKIDDIKKILVSNLYYKNRYNDMVYRVLFNKLKKSDVLRNKMKKLLYFDKKSSVLYGYKFHFVGRFTRKQRSANLWLQKGSLANSSAKSDIDYGTCTVVLRFSICNVKVWLYKTSLYPSYKSKVIYNNKFIF